jgi:Ca2+-binding EF-hand superfamily protein
LSHPSLVTLSAIVALASASAVNAQTKAPANPTLPRAQFIADMDNEFRKMDADKNGQLTRAEIEQYQKLQAMAQGRSRNRALFAQLDAANGQPMIARMDGNRDSQVSLVEHRAATVANFDRLDADKDGIVTAAEMKAGGITPRQ